MPRSSSPSPSITAMNLHPGSAAAAAATPAASPAGAGDEDDILNTLHLHIDPDSDPDRRDLFLSSGSSDDQKPPPPPRVDPAPHISTQFYTFNRHSHALMTRCILDSRAPSPTEIRAATPAPVLTSWRAVWKDRSEDTAYLTAWKRIQDKLSAHASPDSPSTFLYFKSNSSQCVSHYDQWQDIVSDNHTDPDLLRHLSLKDTLDRIRRSWTVGAKFYGIPESFIRVCVTTCQVCNTVSTAAPAPTPRRRFHYTETLEVPAREVPQRLQQLACDHKAVLCIRQKYIRFKPFMAEVKDYACHRAGSPAQATVKKPRTNTFVRDKYKSKRCGCGFRIRAIVPITHYNENDKSFFYQEEGTAVFKLYAVHSGHEPGALDGNARIMHRIVGQKGGLDVEPVIYGVEPEEEMDNGSDDPSVILQQVHELRAEVELLEGKIAKMPPELLPTLSREVAYVLHRLRRQGSGSQLEALVARDDIAPHWEDEANNYLHLHDRVFNKDNENIEEEETDLDSTLGNIIPWNRLGTESHDRKVLVRGSCEPDKWTGGEDHEESNSVKLTSHDGARNGDPSSADIQVEGYYQENPKWFDSPSGLEASVDSGDDKFKDGGLCEESRQCFPDFPEEGRDL